MSYLSLTGSSFLVVHFRHPLIQPLLDFWPEEPIPVVFPQQRLDYLAHLLGDAWRQFGLARQAPSSFLYSVFPPPRFSTKSGKANYQLAPGKP